MFSHFAPLPPLRPAFLSPFCAALLKPPLGRSAFPSCAAFPPYARRCRAAALILAPLRVARDSRPRFGHGPAADAAGRGLRRGRLSSPLARLRVELARGALARHAGLCPSGKAARVKIGGVLRGVLPRSSALRASGGGARGDAVRGSPPRAQPRLRSALRLRLRLRASFKSAETADFQRRLSVRAFQGHFSGSFRRFGGYKCPPRLHFTQKMASKGAARPPATRPECLATRKTRGHLLFGGLPARRGLRTASGTVPTARTRSGLGSGLRPFAA